MILILSDVNEILSDEKRHSYRLLSAVGQADRKNNKGPQYITKSNTSSKKPKVSNCYKRDANTGQHLTFNAGLEC